MSRYRVFEWFGYVAFTFLLGAILFAVGFPQDKAVRWGLFQVEERTGIRVDVEGVKYVPLFGIMAERVIVHPVPWENVKDLDLGRVMVSLSPFSILSGALLAVVESRGDLGNISGVFECADELMWRAGRVALDWSEISMGELGRVAGADVMPKGKLAGSLDLSGMTASPLTWEGKGRVQMHDVGFFFSNRLVRNVKIRSGKGGGDLAIQDGKVTLSGWSFKAEGVSGTIEGTVHLAGRRIDCRLDLKGTLKCDPGKLGLPRGAAGFFRKDRPLSFKVRGTLGEPKYGL